VFVQTLTEKLMVYALGRGLTAEDMPGVRAIVRQAKNGGYRFSALIAGIVNSSPFQMRVKLGDNTADKGSGVISVAHTRK
jgi:hypothetical protein